MSASFYDLLKYAATGQASPDMTYYDRMRASTLMGGAVKTLTGVPPLSFTGNGKPLISWSMLGNGEQSGTPSPDNIIMPEFCGKLVGTDWIIPITCAGQTTPIYLGQTQTVRRIKKLVLTGQESGWLNQYTSTVFELGFEEDVTILGVESVSSHYVFNPIQSSIVSGLTNGEYALKYFSNGMLILIKDQGYTTVESWKSYLAQQYSAGTPVTVWYVPAEPETAIVNEPLCKIGDYSDTLDSADAGVSIPTARGQNTLTVDTELQPSSMTITYR